MNCKNKKEHLFGGEIHGIIESVDKIIIQKRNGFMENMDHNAHSVYLIYYHLIMVVKYRRKVINGPISKRAKEIRKKLWKEAFWSQSFCLLTAGGAPVEVIRQYIETQGEKKN